MRLLTKISLALSAILISIAIAPAAKSDPVTVSSGGFHLSNLREDGTAILGLNSLTEIATSVTHKINGAGDFIAFLDPLTLTTGFTATNSGCASVHFLSTTYDQWLDSSASSGGADGYKPIRRYGPRQIGGSADIQLQNFFSCR